MNVNIEVRMNSNGGRFMRKGTFPVKVSDFKRDPDGTAAIVAYEWIQRMKREHTEFVVDRVIYNGENDITDVVKQK